VRGAVRTTHSCPGGPPSVLNALKGPPWRGRAGAAASAAAVAPARPPSGASSAMGATAVSSRVSRTICSCTRGSAAADALAASSPSSRCARPWGVLAQAGTVCQQGGARTDPAPRPLCIALP